MINSNWLIASIILNLWLAVRFGIEYWYGNSVRGLLKESHKLIEEICAEHKKLLIENMELKLSNSVLDSETVPPNEKLQ